MIPQVLHRWWSGPPVASSVDALVWSRLMPRWELRDELGAVPRGTERQMSNVIRVERLLEYGGVWADHDVRPLIPFDGLLRTTDPFVASVRQPEGAVMGGPAGHPFFAALVGALAQNPTALLSQVLAEVVPQFAVTVYPPHTFFARASNGVPIALPSGQLRFSVHGWSSSGVAS